MEKIILKPTHDIETACDLLEKWIDNLLSKLDTDLVPNEFEAPYESLMLLNLMIRNTESIIHIARYDLVTLPSALHLTRAVYEMGIKILWMLFPKEAFDREVRWLVQLQTEESNYERFARHLKIIGIDNHSILVRKKEVTDFRNAVIKVLPEPYKPLKEIPNVYEMLKSIGEEDKYLTYIALSQYSHGTHFATGIYRRGLGNGKTFGEFITPKNWEIVFTVTWYFLRKSGERIFVVLDGNPDVLLNKEFDKDMQVAINNINTLKI